MLHAATSTSNVATRGRAVARLVHEGARPAPPVTPYAGIVTRSIAFAADALLVNVVAIVVAGIVALVFSILPSAHVPKDVAIALGGAAFALWLVGYFTTFWSTTGQTPGDRMLGIKVVRADGSRLRPRHAIVRLAGMVISAPLLLGYLPILVTERRRGLHDWLAGTVVITAPPSETP
jgi:uncharacterized RDD family membrane protein YckC